MLAILVGMETALKTRKLTKELLLEAKRLEFPDYIVARLTGKTEAQIKELRAEYGIRAAYKMVDTCAAEFAADPGYPSLQTHEIEPLSRRYGMKVWQSYLENKTSGAMRMYWVYGPDQKDITIIGLEPHPEDKKNGAYDRISLSDL